ncbi:hypothetical protein BFP70_19035 [Thioclava sp. SK-1]|uniref:hypothetical protein n=1 Tax=Thioclava sp. SK-1 TaxID=1889770 RepID=UPI0008248310|nr:hypothetical protein [Thioclava sp. SK-1]OCX58155.1 hypothetical protein BFP70_19035 [Thioclava sp. SK-1]
MTPLQTLKHAYIATASLSRRIVHGLVITCALTAVAAPSLATEPMRRLPPKIVGNDIGGLLSARIQEISQLERSGRQVVINGDYCISACTMYISLRNVCVYPKTVFGFHGPSKSGKELPAEKFEYWSARMASFYPANLARWYMKTGRHARKNYYRIRGAELIRQGVPACS